MECKGQSVRAFKIPELESETYACYQDITTAESNIQLLFSVFGALDISAKLGRQVPKDSRGKQNPRGHEIQATEISSDSVLIFSPQVDHKARK